MKLDATIKASGLELPKDGFRQVVIDWPWKYANRHLVRKDGGKARYGIGASGRYDTMTTEKMCKLWPYINPVLHPDCHIWMWGTMPFVPDLVDIFRAGGDNRKWSTCGFVWLKTNPSSWTETQNTLLNHPFPGFEPPIDSLLQSMIFFGIGHHTASNVEYCVLVRQGRYYPPAKNRKLSQIVIHPVFKGADHSRKPDEVQHRIKYMYPQLSHEPFLELFARRPMEGWIGLGNEHPGQEGIDIKESLTELRKLMSHA